MFTNRKKNNKTFSTTYHPFNYFYTFIHILKVYIHFDSFQLYRKHI